MQKKKKMTVKLYNGNMQLSVLEINRKSAALLLKDLKYLFDSYHGKSMDVHLATELLRYGI